MKRALALLLCVMLLCIAAAPAAAASGPRVSGVDYKRLWKPADGYYSADVIIGNQTFFGNLERELAMTDDEVDDILRKTLRELGMTEGTLMACNDAIEKVKEIKDFDFDKFISLLCSLVGVDNYIDVFGYVTGWGNKSAEAIALDWAVGDGAQYIVESAVEAAGGKLAATASTAIGGFALSVLVNAGKISITEMNEWSKHMDILEKAMEAHRKLQLFYARANKNLAAEDERRGGQWRIHIDDSHTNYQVDFMGVAGNTQTWHCWGTLKRENTSTDKTYDPSGIYKGEFNIEITHDLSSFDTHFFDEVVKNAPFFLDFVKLSEMIAPLLAQDLGISYSPPMYSYLHSPGGASELSKLYHADELSIEVKLIPYVYQQRKVNFYLSEMSDDSTFNVPHSLTCLPEANIWSGGQASAAGASASMDLLFGYKGGFKEPTVPALYPEALTTNLFMTTMGESFSYTDTTDLSIAGDDYWRLIVGEDREILRSLRGRTCFLISGGD